MAEGKISKEEDALRRDMYIDMVCEESGLDRDFVAKEMDYAKEHGIKYKVYALKGYWNVPHDKLVEFHEDGISRRKMARIIAKKRGKDHHAVEKEMIYARYKLGLRFKYFRVYKWDTLTEEQKAGMLLRPVSEHMSNKYMKPDGDVNILDDKQRFYETFPEFIKRKWMAYEPDMTLEEFQAGLADFTKEDVLYKPHISSGGRGIRKFSLKDGAEAVYRALQADGSEPALIEEFLDQHPDMSSLCADCINTIRAVTLCWEGEYHLFYTLCRMGAGNGTPVDSFTQGGLLVSVDAETGRFDTVGVNNRKKPEPIHPGSGIELLGFQVPYWDEVLEFVRKAAFRANEAAGLGYTGWDVAITPDGPAMIEGNNWPDCDIYQMCHWLHDQKGMGYLFEPYL